MTPLEYAQLLHEMLMEIELYTRFDPKTHRKVLIADLCIDEVLKHLEKEDGDEGTLVPF